MREKPRPVLRLALWLALAIAAAYPLPAQAPKPLWSVTSFGSNDFFQEPSDIEVDEARSLIYVVDAGSARVLVFDFEGRFLKAIGRKGQGPGEFARPTGAGLLPDGALAVADFDGGRIELFDAAGTFVRLLNVTDVRVADLVAGGGMFYTVPSAGRSGYAVAMGDASDNQPLVNVLDGQGKKVARIEVPDYPETQPFIRAIKHRVIPALSPQGELFLTYSAANRVQVFKITGEKTGDFSRPLPFKPITPGLVRQRSPEAGVVQMQAELDFVSLGAKFGPDGRLYVLTVTESLADIRRKNPDLDPLPVRFDVIDPVARRAVGSVACDAGARAFGLLSGGRLVYVFQDAEGELTLRCVRF